MTFRQGIKFMESEVMREMERQAIHRGEYDSSEVEEAAIVVKAVSYKPSKDLYADILKLASGLRERGFVGQADELEKNVLIYKQAETHLYRVHDEDGADILGFAHPEGEVHIFDAQMGLGDFETLLSAQEKMLAVVAKKPLGKMASLAALVKEAEDEAPLTDVELKRNENQRAINEYMGGLKSNLGEIAKSFPSIKDSIASIQSKLSASIDLSTDSYTDAIQIVQKSIKETEAAVSIATEVDQFGISKKAAINGYAVAANIVIKNIMAMTPSVAGQEYAKGLRLADSGKLSEGLGYINKALVIWGQLIETLRKNNDQENIVIASENIGLLRAISVMLSRAIKTKTNLNSVIEQFNSIQKDVSAKSEDDIVAYCSNQLTETQSNVATASIAEITLNKFALKPLSKKTVPAKAPAGTAPSHAGSTGHAGTATGRPTKDEKQTVGLLQRRLSDLASNLAAKAETLNLQGITPEQISADAKVIGYTGQDVRGEGPLDGKWGKNTIAALTAVGKYLTAVGMPATAIVVGPHYLSVQPVDVISKANNNVGALNELMEKLGFPTADKPAGATAFDKVPPVLDLPGKNWSPKAGGNVPITSGDLGTLQDLYLYMTDNSIKVQAKAKNSLEKLADKFVSIAQAQGQPLPQLQMGQEVYDPWAGKSPAAGDGLTVSQMETALKWLLYRSNRTAAAAPNNANAQQYYRMVYSLYNRFQNWKANSGKGPTDTISPDDFSKPSGGPTGAEHGAGKPARDRGGRSGGESAGDGGEGSGDEDYDLAERAKPPFQSTNYPINIAGLLERYGLDSGWFNENLATNFITRQMLYNPSASWQHIMSPEAISELEQQRSSANPMAAHPGGWFNEFAQKSIQALHYIFNAWYRNAPSSESVRNQQVQYLNQWISAFVNAQDALNGWMRSSPQLAHSQQTQSAPAQNTTSVNDVLRATQRGALSKEQRAALRG